MRRQLKAASRVVDIHEHDGAILETNAKQGVIPQRGDLGVWLWLSSKLGGDGIAHNTAIADRLFIRFFGDVMPEYVMLRPIVFRIMWLYSLVCLDPDEAWGVGGKIFLPTLKFVKPAYPLCLRGIPDTLETLKAYIAKHGETYGGEENLFRAMGRHQFVDFVLAKTEQYEAQQ